MDSIVIKDLVIYANHGVYEEEKKLGQKFLVTLELFLSLREAGKTENLDKSVDYGVLSEEITHLLTQNSYDLIERCAQESATFILDNYDLVKKVNVEIKKPWAPIGYPLEYVSVKISCQKHRVFIALGSNIGDLSFNLNTATSHISALEGTAIIKKATPIMTKPVGDVDQDDFLNSVIEIETTLTPEELMESLLSIEKEMKRKRTEKWGPRIIDLDILFYDTLIIDTPTLTIPHPLLHERQFVLSPMKEIAPHFLHPVYKKTIRELKHILDETF